MLMINKPTESDVIVSRMKREARKAETAALDKNRAQVKGEVADAGTGFTILRLTASPITRLVERRKRDPKGEAGIGADELRAAEEICEVYFAKTRALWIKPPSMERRDPTHDAPEPIRIIDATRRYKNWTDHWSVRTMAGIPILACTIEAVVHEWPFWVIGAEHNIRTGRAEKAVIAGLRDYAARNEFVDKRTARTWMLEAGGLFKGRVM